MLKSKISPSQVKELKWKDYVKLLNKDLKQIEAKGLKNVPVVLVSDFTFACGEVHTLMLFNKQSVLTKYYKSLKADEERKKQKDFAMGMSKFEKNDNNILQLEIGIKQGLGKPARMKKNSKKLIKKLGIDLVDITKGDLLEEVVSDIEEENKTASAEYKIIDASLQAESGYLKTADDLRNDTQSIVVIAKEFKILHQQLGKELVPFLKKAAKEKVSYQLSQVELAEKAFRTGASLLDKYGEETQQKKPIPKAVIQLKEQIETNDLVNKYEKIWKKIKKEHAKQNGNLDELLKTKFKALDELMKVIESKMPKK